MSDILDDYRVRQACRPDRVQTHYLGCHMHHDECMIALMAEEITRLRAEVERLRAAKTTRGTGNTPTLAAGARAENREGGSGNRQPPHSSPASAAVTDDRPAPTAVTLTDAEVGFLKLHRERLVWWAHSSRESAAELATVDGLLARMGAELATVDGLLARLGGER